ncbi:MAG: hypothetical protein KJZ80_08115 [Hyphomicrobiaceae bacterium]|nr:hypothetical protein [Hyphomicrobiaceae bacterium]
MRLFLITYDLAKSNGNKHAMATAIMGLGQAWARPLETTWYVRAETSEDAIQARLSGMLDTDDGLIVQAVSEEALLVNTSLRWFRQRRTALELEASSNVIAFPAATASPAETELPLAQAG